ncbi:hypothetical protein MMC12_002102 [Toensbergia leucococca]|nr:hypothetical protein [Toensbergia leucococca]
MASPLAWLGTCKVSQLKAIASATGINSTGSKPILTSRLLDQLQEDRFQEPRRAKPQSIISIDMGIRNLAYCQILLPKQKKSLARNDLPVVESWDRIVVSRRAEPSICKIKEPFDPATYSQHAYDLVSRLITTMQPTQILIERQRFRSMGGSAVQEWTLRVNMFEAMIYAVLKTFSEQASWTGAVYPVAPGKVSKFWLGEPLEDSGRVSASKSGKTKTAKIDLVRTWLEEKSHLVLQGQAKTLGRVYLGKRQDKERLVPEGKRKLDFDPGELVPDKIGKLDDLADCLLQGMAWIKWEENRRSILTKGLDALDEMD